MQRMIAVSAFLALLLLMSSVPSLQPSHPAISSPLSDDAAETMAKGLNWLVAAQSPDGGWGAGFHAHQDVLDPHAVQSDPATTAMAAMALIRTGNTLKEGAYQQQLSRALEYLLQAVAHAPANGGNITSLTGTQPQVKLGQNIDISLTSQFFTRIQPLAADNPQLSERITQAQNECLKRLQQSINTDGSSKNGTWAGVLQSAVANNALEEASEKGAALDEMVITSSRKYQARNVDATTGAVATDRSAGVTLYSVAGTTRATAKEAKRARDLVQEAQDKGLVEAADPALPVSAPAPVTADNLRKAGVSEAEAISLVEDYNAYETASRQLKDDQVLAGFGNNGGEEFLSYMMTSEAMVVNGGEAWTAWSERMTRLLPKIQNADGSWSGHHCITSPVFCTAAVLMTMSVK